MKNRKRNKGFVYVLKCANTYKIGYSKCVKSRIRQLDTRPFKLELVYMMYSDFAYDVEQKTHSILKDFQIANEWYSNIVLPRIMFTIENVHEKLEIEEILKNGI